MNMADIGKYHIQLWPEEVIELNRELASGLHPRLEKILNELPPEQTLQERLGHVAAYCLIKVDAVFDEHSLMEFCKLLRMRLEERRERPDSVIDIH